jgi:CBS domain-containing protein
VGVDATAWEVLDVVAVGGRDRTSDDVAVVDAYGRCVGVVRLADLVRALAETRVEEAAGLNPLTRLPGSDAITGGVGRRIAAGRPALSWLDVDHFKQVNDGAGFAAGDELIRAVGRALQQAATGTRAWGTSAGTTPWSSRTWRALIRWPPPCWTRRGRRSRRCCARRAA